MEKLADLSFSSDTTLVDKDTQEVLLAELTEWRVDRVNTVPQLVRCYKFGNFVDALAFANRVGALAEEKNHHPALLVEWGRVTVSWWTHSLGGLHKNDFIMAARTDRCYLPG
jgi:4a-hydroxytetrahydrobiopterin dehydratase